MCEAGKCTSPAALPPAPPAPPGSEAPANPTAATAPPGDGAVPAEGQPPPVTAPLERTLPPTSVEPPLGAEKAANNELPPAALTSLGQDEPQTRRRSRNAMVTGIVMASVGPISLLGALAAKNAQDKCDTSLAQSYPDRRLPTSERYRVEECDAYSVPLYVFGVGGLVLTAAGIPLIIYGARQLPATPAGASLRVLPWASPDSSGLKLRLEM